MIAQPPPARTRMTNAEYFQTPESNQLTELVNGEIIVLDSPIVDHQAIVVRLVVTLYGLIPNGTLLMAPMDVAFAEGQVRQPDVLWIAENSNCVIDKRIIGAPDLIMEVFSPSTEATDRGDKYALYERHGVREYWMVNPDQKFIEVYTHDGTRFVRAGIYVAGQAVEFASPILGKTVPLGPVFA